MIFIPSQKRKIKSHYLQNAYKQLQEQAEALEDKLKIKFINYLIPRAITKEYNKVFK